MKRSAIRTGHFVMPLLVTSQAQQAILSLGIAAVLLLGAGIALAPLGIALATVGALLVVGLMLAMGRLLRVQIAVAQVTDSNAPEGTREFVLARRVYYLGVASLGFLTVRPLLGLTLSDLVFFCALLALLAESAAFRMRTSGYVPGWALLATAAFAVGGLASSALSRHPVESVEVVARLVYLTVVWFWLGTVVLTKPRHVKRAIVLWATSAALTGAAALIQLRLGDVVPGGAIEWGRMTGLTQHVNDLGGLTGIALVPALMIATRSRRLIGTILGYGVLLVIGVGLVLSGSVGGMLAACVGCLAWVAWVKGSLRSMLLLIAILAAAIFILSSKSSVQILSPLERVARVTAPSQDPNATFWSRVQIDGLALAAIANNPLVGVGLDQESSVTEAGFQVHNSLLGAWYEAGILGFGGLAALLIGILAFGRVVSVSARSGDEWAMAVALLASSLAWIVFGMGAPVLYKRFGWLGAALLVCLRAQQLRSTSRESEFEAIGGTPGETVTVASR